MTAVGDIRFMTVVGILSLWIISVGCAYIMGIQLHWGLGGIYAAMIADEFIRGAILLPRWMSRKYLPGARSRLSPQTGAFPSQ